MSTEFHERNMSNPERFEAFENVCSRIERLTRRVETLGMEIHSAIEVPQQGFSASKQAEVPVFGASLGKLPLAAMAIECLEPYAPLDLENVHGVDSDITAAELVEKMLKRSDNVSYRILAEVLGGPAVINDFYEDKGWADTRVKMAPNGRAQLAETTAHDSLTQLKYLLGAVADNELADVARRALSEQEVTRYGIRRLKIDDPDVHIFNKTGEYNGDIEDPYVFRHDVGSIMGKQGRINYALMTAVSLHNPMPSLAKKYLADSTVKQFGAELVEYVGGTVNRGLGRQAVRGMFKSS